MRQEREQMLRRHASFIRKPRIGSGTSVEIGQMHGEIVVQLFVYQVSG